VNKTSPHQTSTPRTPPGSSHSTDRAGRAIAGYTILAIAALSAVGNFVAVQPLADDAITATELTGAAGSLRLGIAALSIVAVLDVVVSVGLYKAFHRSRQRLVGVTCGLRLAYAAGLAFAIAQLFPIARHLGGDLSGASTAARRAGAQAGVEHFNDVWHVALMLFGLHLIGLAIVTRRAGMPRVLVVLLAVAGAGYLVDSLSNVLIGTSPEVSAVTFIGEFTLALWLVGRRGQRAPRHETAMYLQPALP
jgi:hypothetical protein